MTISAGFVCSDGILLCSETEYSGESKFYDQKIFTRNLGTAYVVFALSGVVSHAMMAMRDFDYRISAIEKPSLRKIEHAFRRSVRDVYDQYFQKWEDDFSVFMGVRAAHGRMPLLFVSTNRAVDQVRTFECRGSGSNPGLYIISKSYDPMISLSTATTIGLQALSAAKRHSAGVSGPSQFVAVTRFSGCDVFSKNFEVAEEQIRLYENATGSLLRSFGSLAVDRPSFEKALEIFGRFALSFRDKLVANSEYLELLQKIANPTAQEDPQAPKPDRTPPPPSPESPGRSGES